MESLRVLHNFKFDSLDEGWIKSVWDSEFITYGEPPDEYLEYLESEDARLLLHESRRVLKAWIVANEDEHESSEFSWQALMILNINIPGLLATLGYIMKTGQCTETADEDARQACLEATSLYLMFLTVPGSNAFRVYHPNLYQRAIETLKLSKRLVSSVIKSSKKINTIISSIDDESADRYDMLHSERLKLVKGLNRIISDLVTMLKSFWFKEYVESLDVTVRVLLDVTRLEMCVKHKSRDDHRSSLSQNAFAALQELCNSNHGSVALTIMLIAQYMLPDLLFYHANVQSKFTNIVHEAAIYFLKSLLKTHESETAQGIVTLMHQLMVKCPERLDGRQRQAAVVIKLLNICNKDIVSTIFRDIILFSHNGRISCRLFAQEIVGKLLTESSLSNSDLNQDAKLKMRRILIAIVSSRCMDRSAFVRGRAMATLASFSDCNDDADKSILKSIFETPAADKTFPVLDELERALSDDVDPLPGSKALLAMLLDRVNDERALIRRSVLKILRNLSVMFPSLIGKMMHVMSERCRDPTLTVRQFAVHVLSEILQQFPHNSGLLDEWVRAVVPQIYDVETKVQEKVLECLETVLIRKITSASAYVPDAANSLPWRILDKLSNMRMRKNLSKACSLWIKNGVITKSTISKLQSHIGTDNTVNAWVLLASLAENMKIPNIDRYIADYKEVIRKNDFHASLVLHVLRHTWSALDRDCLEDLYQYLYRCICRFEINFNLISICLDILSGILRYLHVDKNELIESNMVELMRLSEAEIQDLLEESESCAQDTLKMRAIFTLGHASLLCTNKISPSTLRIFEKLLLQWESLPEAVKEIKNLQASAVILFCQQALRDREMAKEVTPILGNLMCQETHPDSLMRTAVKINAAKALADICVRFTALVEPYLPDMCISMKDSNPAVREAIVVIFIQLLLEDFIKMKGPFFFHILTMLSDTDSMIRELTVFLVEERLLVKNKTLISQQFLDSIYHYNNHRSRSACCGHRMHDRERKLFTLPGRANQSKRNVIYEFMLEHLDASAKSQLIVKLTQYILREVCDGDFIDIATEEGAGVLRDTVFIISNNRLQLSSLGEKHRDDTCELDETTTIPSGSSNNNATNVIIAAVKKYHLDNLLPTLITLKKKLAVLKSPLGDDVCSLLFKIYSEHEKEQLLSLLNEYPELEKEMDHYQRRLKDKTTSENDDGITSLSPIASREDSLLDRYKRKTPRVLLHRLSSSMNSQYKNSSSINSDNCLPITISHATSVESPSVNLDRLLQTPPPEPGFSTSTPISRHLNLCSNDSSTQRLHMKRPSSERDISPDIPRCKTPRLL